MGICPLAVDSYVSATTHQGAFWSALYLQLCLSLVFCECDSWFPEEPQVPGSQPFFWAGFLCPAGPAFVPARCGTWWLRCEENPGRTHCTAAQGFSTLTNSSAHTLNYCLEDKKWCSQYFEFDGFMLWSFLILLQCRFLKLWCSYLWAYWLVGFHIYVFIFPSMQHGSLCCVTTFRKWPLYRTWWAFCFWRHFVPPGVSLLPAVHLTVVGAWKTGVKAAPSTREIPTPAWAGTLGVDEQRDDSPTCILREQICKQVSKPDYYKGTTVGQDEATLSGCVAENSAGVPDPLFFNEDIIIKE